MEPVLVLNANFEPLNVCGTRRAICLILMEKANLVVNGRGVIHSVNHSFPRPSIIRLEAMIKKPRPRVKLTKKEIFRRDKFTCQYCGNKKKNLTIDHIIPRHMGGEHNWTNVITACANCNHKKGGRKLSDAGMHLRIKPYEPSSSAMYLFQNFLPNNEEWEQFLIGW